MGETLKRRLIGAIVLIAIVTVILFILLPNPHPRSEVLTRSDSLHRDSIQASSSAANLVHSKLFAADRREKERRAVKPSNTLPERWAVQIGSFTEESNARNLLRRVQALGLPVFIRRVANDTKQMTRVLVGPFATKATATEFMTKLRKQAIPARIVHHP